ncbi:carbohydrate kinase family protein [Bradyrhizobium sp. 2TAF24]|uniref:carbohydrate kinase family protein n=1 Tax=Bradyrhizobium sp. 2TAF24 TaxID=3233011 RepID=UPI003F8E9772
MLLSCGDALIDFLPVRAADGRDAMAPVVGGSCLNIAVGMARLGAAAGFVGGLSTDMFGQMIASHATASGVDLRFAARSGRQTTLAFVRMEDGEPRYAFYDEGSAARSWRHVTGAMPFAGIRAVHVGSTTLVDEAAAAHAMALAVEARAAGAGVAFDPNCRPALVTDRAVYRARIADFIAAADIVRMSDVDFAFLHDDADMTAVATQWLAAGARLVVVTRGGAGAQAWHRGAGTVAVQAPQVDVVDTIGAGDSFQAALLVALAAMGRIAPPSLAHASADDIHRALTFAAACAAITCSRPGADPPRRAQLPAALQQLLVRSAGP